MFGHEKWIRIFLSGEKGLGLVREIRRDLTPALSPVAANPDDESRLGPTHKVAALLEEALWKGALERIVLVADQKTLADLRQTLSVPVLRRIDGEIRVVARKKQGKRAAP